MILTDFRHHRPAFFATQEAALDWLAQAHSRAQALSDAENPPRGEGCEPPDRFRTRIRSLFRRYGCSPERIKTRGHELADFSHTDWERMELFSLASRPQGPTMSERSAVFRRIVDRACRDLYQEVTTAPAHLIHVTCTGYLSPSCAQELAVRKGWHERTVVTHAYHMGCSAALPAIRMAQGFLAAGARHRPPRETAAVRNHGDHEGHDDHGGLMGRVEILHTEICSLHLQPWDHSPEQLVVQSLFADGCIRYSARASLDEAAGTLPAARGLRLLAIREVQVPDTRSAITWECGEWGMRMGLSREVPETICRVLPGYLRELFREAGLPFDDPARRALFAIHPGGPKIIDQIRDLLGLSEDRIAHSTAVLRDRGNMSSATLPHIWERLLADSSVAPGTPVVSLAFGPGLTVSGAVFEVVGQ